MFKRNKICTAALAALGGTLLGTYLPVLAQDQTVEVTGSRIKSLDGTSISPIESVSEAQIRAQQPAAIEEVIRGLPAAVPAIGPGTNNGTGGGATIDLRGLGENRTLVLMNGRRMVPFDLNGVVDTNSVPVALLRRVDLVTGGASAVYGADAVSGVVNFVLKRDFQGVDLTTSYGLSSEGDANKRRTDLTIGSSLADGRGNVVLSMGTTRTDPLLQGERAIGQVSRSSTTGRPQGSFTTVPAYLDSAEISYQLDNNGDPSSETNTFNFNPLNYFQTPLDRMQGTALANFVINDYAEVYAEMYYTRSNVVSNLAPSGTFFNTYSVPIGNPFLSPALRADICAAYGIAAANCVPGDPTEFSVDIGRRFTELGPRINDFKNKTFQVVAGVKGAIAGSWGYDAYLSRGESDQTQSRVNWGSSSKVQQALRSLTTTDCIDPSNGCKPLNVFGAEGTITPEMLKFINLSSLLTTSVKQDVLAISATGDLGSFTSPMSQRPINVAVGYENRKQEASSFSDSASQILGEVLGTGAPTPDTTGTIELNELYAEAVIPIVTNASWARSLNLEAGYRWTDFKTTSSSTNYGSWKFGGDWEPTKGLRFRAMQQRATRAPNISELYSPLVTGLDNLAVDPCQGASMNPADVGVAGTLTNLCVQTGVPAARAGSLPPPSAGQVNVLSGGNPALQPEEADTLTVGFIWEPSFAPGLAVSLDYYKIDIVDAVSTPSVSDVMDGCYSSASNPSLDPNNPACAAAAGRNTSGTYNGSGARGVALPQSNLGKQATAGFDLGMDYRLNLSAVGAPGWGMVDIGFQLNNVDKYWFQATPSSVQRDCLGFYSVACGAPNYEQKFSQRTVWNMADWTVGYNWRYLSGVTEEPGGTNFLPAYSKISSYSYVDLTAQWRVHKNVRLNLSINNVFDKAPPEVGNTIGSTSTNSGNTFPQNYDVIGRYWTLGASVTF